jgi:hypothetical protein
MSWKHLIGGVVELESYVDVLKFDFERYIGTRTFDGLDTN